MSKVAEMRKKIRKQAERDILEETKKRLEEALVLKKQGDDLGGNKIVNDLSEWLMNLVNEQENYSEAVSFSKKR